MAIKKSAIVIDTSLNYQKIDSDFQNLEKKTQSLINKYNKSCDSIRSQELAIEKVNQKNTQLQSNTKKYEEELSSAEKELKKILNEYDKLSTKLTKKEKLLSFTDDRRQIETINSSIDTLKGKINEADVSYEKQSQIIDKIKEKIELSKNAVKNGNSQIELMKSKLSQSKDEANQTRKSLLNLTNQKMNTKNIEQLQNGVKEINKNIQNFSKRITGLLVSAFVFNVLSKGFSQMQSTMFSLLKTNNQFASNLNQIKANLMTAFAPIYNACLPAINALMNALSKITGTIAVFVASLFGKSLKQAKNEAKGLSKQLGNVKKNGDKAAGSLSQIDKLDVLADSGSSANTSGGGGVADIDYSGEIQTSSTLLELLNKIRDFVVENKDLIVGFLIGLAAALIAVKLGCSGILSLGIGLMVWGVIYAVQSLIEFLKDPTFENFTNIIIGIGIAITGLGLIIGSLPLTIAGAIAIIVGLVLKNYDKIIRIFDSLIKWLETSFKNRMIELFGPLGGFISDVIITAVKMGKTAFEGFFGGIKKIVNGIVLLFKGDFKNGIKQVFDGLKSIAFGPLNAIITGLNCLIDGINKIQFDVPDWVPGIGGKKLGFKLPHLPHLAEGTVIPPRQEFAAILGDQKHGTNIEAPLETIKQANREVLTEFFDKIGDLSSKVQEIILKNLSIVIQLGVKDFKKVVYEAVRMTEKEMGIKLFAN